MFNKIVEKHPLPCLPAGRPSPKERVPYLLTFYYPNWLPSPWEGLGMG